MKRAEAITIAERMRRGYDLTRREKMLIIAHLEQEPAAKRDYTLVYMFCFLAFLFSLSAVEQLT